jgi:putative membrane-bound dehydrogenase-like protein
MQNMKVSANKLWFWLTSIVILFTLWAILGIWRDSSQQVPGLQVPKGYTIEEAVKPGLVKYPMFAVFDDQGGLFVMESSGHTDGTEEILDAPDFQILHLTDQDEDGVFDHKTIYADKIPFPMGGTFVDGSLIVTASPDLVKFTDHDGDGMAEEKEVLLSGWNLNHNAAILSGPFMGPDGWLYMADARRGYDIQSKEFVNFKGKGARIWRCLPNGSQLQIFAGGGFDNAIELVFSPSGDVFGTMTYFTDPQGGYRDALMHWVEDGVYPKPSSVIEEDKLVRTGQLMPVMHKMARVSPSGLMRYKGDSWGDQYQGNLFHAEFNTGRIIKTVISPSGATYAAESEHFMTSQLPDFHPTDVLQEPGGDLLVVNTGGWFISGCPLSRTAKPEIAGGIFRISKNDKKAISNDLWGTKIPWESLSVSQLVGLLDDSRWKVSEKAGEYLLKQPLSAIPYLTEILDTHENEAIRTKAVFLLFRTQNPRAWSQVIKGLKDRSDQVKIAAARVLGMAEVISAREELISLLENQTNMALARQVAVALGQIGDPTATKPLLELLKENADDRFLGHAVIYALIQMENEKQLLEEIQEGFFNKAALIALDQKQTRSLNESLLKPYLNSPDSTSRGTALWVLRNHPEWENAFTGFLKYYFAQEDRNFEELAAVIPTFINTAAVQTFLAGELMDPYNSVDEKFLILSHIENTPPKEMTFGLKNSLFELLDSQDERIQRAVIALAIQIKAVDFIDKFKSVIAANQENHSLRLSLYQGLITLGEPIAKEDFQWVARQLLVPGQQPLHGQSLNVLRNIPLSSADLGWLLATIFPKVSNGDIPYLIGLFDDINDIDLQESLAKELLNRKDIWDNLSTNQLADIFEGSTTGSLILDSLERRQEDRLFRLEEMASGLVKGDVDRGRAIFFGKGACGTCHAVAGRGMTFGPDLTNIGEIRSRHDILEAMLYPAASFAREYETVSLRTGSQKYLGIIKKYENGRYELALGPGSAVQIEEKDIEALNDSNQSLMPAGLLSDLDNQEISDLMLYLQSLPDGIYTRNN